MDREELEKRLGLLIASRGDPSKKILAASIWKKHLGDVEHEALLRAAVAAVRELLLPHWASIRPTDDRPEKALAAAEAWMASPSDVAGAALKAATKGCTDARNETFGTDNRTAEAAREVARGAKDVDALFEAFASIEGELVGRVLLSSQPEAVPEQRKALVAAIGAVLLPPVAVAAAAPRFAAYSPKERFAMGDRLQHKTFGEIVVLEAGATSIDVELPDGSRKRLAHAAAPKPTR